MDLFVLDSQFRRIEVFDQFESLIWTERVASAGDFEFILFSDIKARTLLVQGAHLGILQSSRVMTVETVEDGLDAEGRAILTVKGPSLEDILNDRVARDVLTAPQPQTQWIFTAALPAEIARTIFKQICVDLTISPGDAIPFYTPGNFYPVDNVPEPSATVTMSISVTTVYEAIKQICDIYNLGFRLVRNGDTSQIMFNIFAGSDRTTSQTILPAVIFAPELDNLQDVSYLTSTGGYKNVAYVVHPFLSTFVYANGVDASVAGFDRKVLYVDANDIGIPDRKGAYVVTTSQAASISAAQALGTTTQAVKDSLSKLTNLTRLNSVDLTNLNAIPGLTTAQQTDITIAKNTSVSYNATEDAWLLPQLQQKGRDQLAQNTNLAAFDGEIPKNSQYVYERDYYLNDLIEVRNADKVSNLMRVTEQIFASDATGDRSYPTLAVKQLITPGSWYALPTTQVWDDLTDPADTWASR